MEEYLGVLLFQRINKTLILTEAGRSYVVDIRAGLDQMSAATVNLLANKGKGGILNLASPPAFCSKWLIPRLDKFSSQHPGILLNISTRAKPFDFDVEHFDMAIHYGRNDWPDVISDKLLGEELVVVGAQTYLEKRPALKSGSDLRGHVLLQQATRYNRWCDWLRVHNVSDVNAWAGPRFEHVYMVMQAAVAGLGLALLPKILIEDEVALGRLVMPFDDTFVVDDVYFLVYPASKKSDPKLVIFREWALAEAAVEQPIGTEV